MGGFQVYIGGVYLWHYDQTMTISQSGIVIMNIKQPHIYYILFLYLLYIKGFYIMSKIIS